MDENLNNNVDAAKDPSFATGASMTMEELSAKIKAGATAAAREGWDGSTNKLGDTHTPSLDECGLRLQILERRALRAEAFLDYLFSTLHRNVNLEQLVSDYEKSLDAQVNPPPVKDHRA